MVSLATRLAVLAASATVVVGQTYTDCDPTKKTCPNDPALAGEYTWEYGQAAPDFTVTAGADAILYGQDDGSAIFRVAKKGDAPTIVSDFYIMWGYIEVEAIAAPGGGVVSSIVLQSDVLDELDWEWVGYDMARAQSNYFGKGNTDSYDRGAFHDVDSTQYHRYGLKYTQEKIEWSIDDVVVRTLTPDEVKGTWQYYPQTPMQLRIGSWAAGDPSNEAGTVSWSGGPINYDDGPFDMKVKKIYAQDYSNGKEYKYGDMTGSWESIVAVDGTINAGPQSGNSPNDLSSASTIASSGGSQFNAPTNSGRESSATSTSEPSFTTSTGSGENETAGTDIPAETTATSGSSAAASSVSGSVIASSNGTANPTSNLGTYPAGTASSGLSGPSASSGLSEPSASGGSSASSGLSEPSASSGLSGPSASSGLSEPSASGGSGEQHQSSDVPKGSGAQGSGVQATGIPQGTAATPVMPGASAECTTFTSVIVQPISEGAEDCTTFTSAIVSSSIVYLSAGTGAPLPPLSSGSYGTGIWGSNSTVASPTEGSGSGSGSGSGPPSGVAGATGTGGIAVSPVAPSSTMETVGENAAGRQASMLGAVIAVAGAVMGWVL